MLVVKLLQIRSLFVPLYHRSMSESTNYDPFGDQMRPISFLRSYVIRALCIFIQIFCPLYTLTRYDDVAEMLINFDLWSSHYGQMPRYSVQGCLFSDPPERTGIEKLIQQSFAPRHIASMETEVTTLVKQLIDVMEEDETRDLHDALAALPVLVIAKI